MQVGCFHSRRLWPHYRQAVQEAAEHLPASDKALRVTSGRSTGPEWTEDFRSGLVFDASEVQLSTITRYHPPGNASVDLFLQHRLFLQDFVWDLWNQMLEQLLRTSRSAAARVHQWWSAAEGDCPAPSVPDKGLLGLRPPA